MASSSQQQPPLDNLEQRMYNEYFKLLDHAQQEYVSGFYKSLYSNLNKYSKPKRLTNIPLTREEQVGVIVHMLSSGLIMDDLTKEERNLLKAHYGSKWEKKLNRFLNP